MPTPHDPAQQIDEFGGRALGRRTLIKALAGAGVATVGAAALAKGGSPVQAADTCPTEIPEETAGPYPGDGSNGPNVLTQDGVVRSDIRSSFGSMSGTAAGIPLTINLDLVDITNGCAPVAGYAVYLWHCDRDGKYSLYSSGITNQNYLRGVQESNSAGRVTFTSIFPACYSGRWPHIHFEVYPSLASATVSTNKIATSQLALPEEVCDVVFATTGYSQSVSNLNQTSLSTDNVFRDGWTTEMATVSGDTTNGYTATLVVGLSGGSSSDGGGDDTGDTTTTPTTEPATVGSTAAYVPLSTPQRLLDTRSGSRPSGGSTLTLAVLGKGGVPSSGVSAVVLNVTATDAAGGGYVTVWPDGTRPETSNLNVEYSGHTRANMVTVPVGSDGAVRLFTDGGTHLVVDAFGYFGTASTSRSGRLQTITPTRVLDTRSGSPVGYSGSKPAAGSTVVASVLGSNGVPSSGVSAVVLNVTATDATAAGYVTAWGPGSMPATSNLNLAAAGTTIANQVVIPAASDGTIRLYTERGTHLIVDVTGWYTDSTAADGTDGLFIPVTPYRVLDSRSGGRPAAGATITLLAAASGASAEGKGALALNVTAAQSAAAGFVTVWPESTRPVASSLNVSAANETIANHVVMAAGGDGGVRLYTETGTHLIADVIGWYV